jgi:hypothetical protein
MSVDKPSFEAVISFYELSVQISQFPSRNSAHRTISLTTSTTNFQPLLLPFPVVHHAQRISNAVNATFYCLQIPPSVSLTTQVQCVSHMQTVFRNKCEESGYLVCS